MRCVLLYKYLRPERIDVLRDGRIRYTQPIYLNDPFDTKPAFRADERRERMKLQSLAAAKRFGWTEGQRLRINRQLDKMYRSSLELFPIDRPESAKETIEGMVESLGVSVAIFSLAERPDSVLMWSHYACDHSGFVIVFDVDYPEWNRVGAEDDDNPSGVLRKVRYSKVRPN